VSFRPFGFAFDVRTALDLAESKRRVRECKYGVLHPDDGPRGFIVGRFICLWNSLIDRQGPMLIGWMLEDGSGCRIKGQSGSDLNGILSLVFAGAMLPIIAAMALLDGKGSTSLYVMLGLCMMAFVVLLVVASNDRRNGLPLVQFLQTVTGGESFADRVSPRLAMRSNLPNTPRYINSTGDAAWISVTSTS
jgi:hypothetical protein